MTRAPTDLAELIAVLASLPALPPDARAKVARSLAVPARAIIGHVGDEAIFEATRERSHAEVAEALGLSKGTVDAVVVRYGKAARGVALTRRRRA